MIHHSTVADRESHGRDRGKAHSESVFLHWCLILGVAGSNGNQIGDSIGNNLKKLSRSGAQGLDPDRVHGAVEDGPLVVRRLVRHLEKHGERVSKTLSDTIWIA